MDNSLLCIQQTDGGETVINYDVDDNSITEDMKMNYAQYIENIREQLLSSKLVYEEELGLCEVGDGKWERLDARQIEKIVITQSLI